MTPSKSPAKSEATAQNLLRQLKEFFGQAAEKNPLLLRDLERLDDQEPVPFLVKWNRVNLDLPPKLIAELPQVLDPKMLDRIVEAVNRALSPET